jgi:hypothetical protein
MINTIANDSEWENLNFVDDVYYKNLHKPCGTVVYIAQGHCRACPKCQPEAWKGLLGGKSV